MLPIIQAPHAVLGRIAKPVTKINKDITNLIMEMTDSLLNAKDPEGVGLAAPQVAKSLQLFIIKESKKDPLMVFINPKLSIPQDVQLPKLESEDSEKENQEVKLEGCLSLQDVWGIVHRYPKVELSYTNEHGENQTKHFDGFMATIIQHEYDHLHGILFPRRVLEQKGQLYKSVKNKDGEIEFEELKV